MECWEKVTLPMRRVWIGVATRLGIRKSGLLKLRHDVRACEYEDVHVMWEMLKKTEAELGTFPPGKRKRPLWRMFEWSRGAPFLCRSF